MFIKEEPGGHSKASPNSPNDAAGQSDGLLQSELERMLAQLSREAAVKKEEEMAADGEGDLDEAASGAIGSGEDGDGDEEEEEEEDGEEEEGDEEEGEEGDNPHGCGKQTISPMENGIKIVGGGGGKNATAVGGGGGGGGMPHKTTGKGGNGGGSLLPNGKKTKGRVKIKMEYIGNKLRRYTTFSKRKTGIMKKANELSTLTGTQVMLLVASETGHVYAFATNKLKPVILSEPGKQLIQRCLSAPDDQVPDLAPSRTEFTFEPPAMGGLMAGGQTMANGVNAGGGGGTNGGGTGGQRKRKAGANGGTANLTTNLLDSGGTFSASTRISQLLNGTAPAAMEALAPNAAAAAAAEEEEEATESSATPNFEDLFAPMMNNGADDLGQRKRARREEPSHSATPSPAPSQSHPAATMDSQQQMKTLKEVLKAASANRLQIQQKQQNGGQNKKGGQSGKGAAKLTAAAAKGAIGGQIGQQNAAATSSQQLGAALLPILLQGLISSSSTSNAPAPSSSPLTASSNRPFIGHCRRGKSAGGPAGPNSLAGQSHQNLPPILYQMPQGVVYATSSMDAEGEEGIEREEEEQRHHSQMRQRHSAAAASCMAAVCSSNSGGSNAPPNAHCPMEGGDHGGPMVGAGNALQQLLSSSLLPTLTAATMTQQLLTAMKGGGVGSVSPVDEDC